MAKIIDGKQIKKEKLEEYKDEIKKINEKLKLVVIQVGNDPASDVYIKNKENTCKEVGILFEHKKYENITENELIKEIEILNNDKSVTGILVQLPLPKYINEEKIINTIKKEKDVDGLTIENIGLLQSKQESLIPCTALGIMEILKYIKEPLNGKNVTIIGRSKLVGMPLIPLLLKENATVTICHSKTKDLKTYTKTADILIVAIGQKEYIKDDYIKENAVVIDVGINRSNGKIYGDCDFNRIVKKSKSITPVPGGVGMLTVTMLINNLIKAYKLQKESEK